MPIALDYLIFDYSEDEQGGATWDAMATIPAARWTALQAEVLQLLRWADQLFPQQRGPLDEGAAWDCELTLVTDRGQDLQPMLQGHPLTLQHQDFSPHDTLTLTLTLTGRSCFADALLQTFEVE